MPRVAWGREDGVSGLDVDGKAEEPWPDLRIKTELCVSQRASFESLSSPSFHPGGRHCLRPIHRRGN